MIKLIKMYIKPLMITTIILIVLSCDPMDYKLKIINNTGSKICYEITDDSILIENKIYNRDTWEGYRSILNNDSTILEYPVSDSWDYIKSESKNGKLNIFIFRYDSLVKYDWKSIVKTKNYIKYISLTKNELDSLDWRIIIK